MTMKLESESNLMTVSMVSPRADAFCADPEDEEDADPDPVDDETEGSLLRACTKMRPLFDTVGI